jgi:phosphatidylethanolamine-binding protein (PEBP) family uncharacterized protein
MSKKVLPSPFVLAVVIASLSIVFVAGVVLLKNEQSKDVQGALKVSTDWDSSEILGTENVCSKGVSPAIKVENLPAEASTYAVSLTDASGRVHWLATNITSTSPVLAAGAQVDGTTLRNYKGNFTYTSPCPDTSETYKLQVFALSAASQQVTSSTDTVQALKLIERDAIAHYVKTVKVER